MPPDSSGDTIQLEPDGVREELRAFAQMADDLNMRTLLLEAFLANADLGDPRGYLNGGLREGHEALHAGRKAEVELRDAIRNALATVDAFEQHDQGVDIGGTLGGVVTAYTENNTADTFAIGGTLGSDISTNEKDIKLTKLELDRLRAKADQAKESSDILIKWYVEVIQRTDSPLEPLDEANIRYKFWEAAFSARECRLKVIEMQKRKAELECLRIRRRFELAQRSNAPESVITTLQNDLKAALLILYGNNMLRQPGIIDNIVGSTAERRGVSPYPDLGRAQNAETIEELNHQADGLYLEYNRAYQDMKVAEQNRADAQHNLARVMDEYKAGIERNRINGQPYFKSLRAYLTKSHNVSALQKLKKLEHAVMSGKPKELKAAKELFQSVANNDAYVLRDLAAIVGNDPRWKILLGREQFNNLKNRSAIKQRLYSMAKDGIIAPRLMEHWRVAWSPDATDMMRAEAQFGLFVNSLELAASVAGWTGKVLHILRGARVVGALDNLLSATSIIDHVDNVMTEADVIDGIDTGNTSNDSQLVRSILNGDEDIRNP